MTNDIAAHDPYDWESFFFGALERDEAEKILGPCPVGSFLLRESVSRPGGYSLSIRESDEGDHQFYHYFIEKKESDEGKIVFHMCGRTFVHIPAMITYYQMHVLAKSCLKQPVPKPALCRVICRYKFDGERVSDLPFERGEVLEIVGKPEEGWWMARNSLKNTGLIPVPYVKIYEEGDDLSLNDPSTNSSSGASSLGKRFSATSFASERSNKRSSEPELPRTPQVPAWVRVVADRYPNIYDLEALTLKEGQIIYLMEVLPTGMCRGIATRGGRIGLFPFSYIEFTNTSLEAGPWNPEESASKLYSPT
ncbi:SH3 domain-containing protein [Ditylenchus destructor]|uniref:SH3 domain-containing protein n=1 Tax=Ditylenchus destructor TaxID=166010 RepID=A0AAD4NJ28_9BILA|nr:SH3 domain-containing protein [Ditylenchus destructor]